jgi:DNA-binding transcriptional LysR family regulator
MPVEKIDLLPNKLYLVGKTKVTKQDNSKKMLDGLPLIFREQGSGTRQTMESYIEKHRITVTKKMELTSNEAVKQSLLAGLGYSIMPVIGIRNELNHDELQIIPIEGLPITTTWSIIWLKGKRLSPVATAYIDYLQKEKERIVSDRFGWCSEY